MAFSQKTKLYKSILKAGNVIKFHLQTLPPHLAEEGEY